VHITKTPGELGNPDFENFFKRGMEGIGGVHKRSGERETIMETTYEKAPSSGKLRNKVWMEREQEVEGASSQKRIISV